jgi:flavin reductase (DIM6/NTAB) family NADH-FMN oxidoreductase RutF
MSSVSAEPPKLLVCVNRSGVSHAQILASGIFCVNVLSDSQDMVARSFAGMLGSRDDRFAVGRWSSLQSGAPVLLDAVCSFDCKLSGVVEQHSHSIIIGDVIAVASRQGAEPLLYGGRRFLTLGETSTSLPGAEGKKSLKSG